MKQENLIIASNKLQRSIYTILMKSGVTSPEIDECIYWAFGKGAWVLSPYPDWMNRWNKLHPQVKVKGKDSFVEFMYVVGTLFLLDKQKKQFKSN